jgi:hypothetical protein
MSLRRALIASFFFVSISALAAQPTQETADRLAASIYTGPAMHTLRELSDGFGGRLT